MANTQDGSKIVKKDCSSNHKIHLPQLDSSVGGLGRRRTSAEMISEAKTFLNDAKTTSTNQAATGMNQRHKYDYICTYTHTILLNK